MNVCGDLKDSHLADKLLFLLLDIDDFGFDGIFGDELIDVDFLLLADTGVI